VYRANERGCSAPARSVARIARAGLVAVLLAGCINFDTLDVGYAASTSGRKGHSGLAVNLRDGSVSTIKGKPVAYQFAVRSKLASELFQIAFGPDFTLFPWRKGRFSTFARAGFHLFQFEDYEDEFAFGAYSPYAEAGVMFPMIGKPMRRRYLVTVGIAAEYDLRATAQPSSGYISFFVGVGYLDSEYTRDPFWTREEPEAEPASEPAPAVEPEPAEETPAEEAPAEETPAEETPAEEAPAEETPAEEAPAEEAPAEEAPAEEAPAEEKPAEEKPAEEKPAEEKPAEKPSPE